MPTSSFRIRPARTADVHAIQAIREPFLGKVLLKHELVGLFEKIQEFLVVTDENDTVVAAGAVHVMWHDLAEVRSVVVDQSMRGQGIGHLLVDALLEKAQNLGVTRVFCLTFETEFFAKHGFEPISDVPVDAETFEEMARSTDLGVAEFLDLARVKENTLGNTRMLRLL
jgi:amino-acid N-acetyltransferase